MQFGSRRTRKAVHPIREEEDEDEVVEQEFHDVKKAKRNPPLALCMQVSLVVTILVIVFIGVIVTLVGVWAHQSQNHYLSITLDPVELTRYPLAAMVIGIFVSVLALVGLVGSLFFRTITGQTLLGSFTFVMVLLIISELAAGAAIFRFDTKEHVRTVYVQSAIASLMLYLPSNLSEYQSTAPKWDNFQEEHECCGAEGYLDDLPPYYEIFGNESVPTSCCKKDVDKNTCETSARDAVTFRNNIYDTGCPDTVMNNVKQYILIIAICVVIAGLSQLASVIFAASLLYMNSRRRSKEKAYYQYNKLSLKGSNPIESS